MSSPGKRYALRIILYGCASGSVVVFFALQRFLPIMLRRRRAQSIPLPTRYGVLKAHRTARRLKPAPGRTRLSLWRDVLPLVGSLVVPLLLWQFTTGRITGVEQLIAVVVPAILLVLTWGSFAHRWYWTGIGPYESPKKNPNYDFSRGKTLWDVVQLLIIPVVVGVATLWFNQRQNEQSTLTANIQTQNAVLDAYLTDISDLLLNHHLQGSSPKAVQQLIAQARTTTALRRLDGQRSGYLLAFASQVGVNLHQLDLRGVNLSGVNLRGADLSNVNLGGVYLHNVNLSFAILTGVNLRGADLSGADLRGASLEGADLRYADLGGADLSGADLRRVDLSGVDLSGVQGITDKQLENEAGNLKGAIMPSGRRHQ